MKKGITRSLALLLTLCLVMSGFVGCGKKATPSASDPTKAPAGDAAQTDKDTTVDTSKKVELVFYLAGDGPDGIGEVQDEINKILLEKINATIKFNFTTWTDTQTKYNMVLSSGEACDLIYGASWLSFTTLAKKHAFYELDELLPKYAPDVYSIIEEDIWGQMKVDGNIYAVPNNRPEYTNTGIQYREDLRKEYDLPVPDSLENIEAYLKGIKDKNPNQNLMPVGPSTGALGDAFSATTLFAIDRGWVTPGTMYGLAAEYNKPAEIFNYWATDEFRTDMKLLKKWADMGFWSKSILSDANATNEFGDGNSVLVCSGQNANKFMGNKITIAEEHPDWEVAFLPYAEKNGVAYANHPTGNCTAVPRNSKNPERALMALNLLYTDETLNRLIQYGIEGKHYTVDENGYYVKKEDNTTYGYEAANTWDLRNEKIMLTQETDVELNKISDRFKEIASKTKYPDADIFSGFAEDYDAYASERAALSTVIAQYLAPIQAGLVDDVDKAIDEFLAKAEQAGLSKIQEAYIAQWKQYCEEYGYNK